MFGLAQVPTSGLVGAWPFSGNANDVSGSGNNGTVYGATLTADRCGNPNSAYSFNGTTNYIQMLVAGPTGSLSRSVSFWAKTTHTMINSPRASFDYGSSNGNGGVFEVVWNYCGPGVGLDLSNQALIRGNACLLNNVWHHIVIVHNATVSAVYSNAVFYIDGVIQPVISCNVSGTNASFNTGNTYPVTIGRAAYNPVPQRFWPGTLDDVYLYNRALTSQEVLQLYNICSQPVIGNTLVCSGSTNVYSIAPITNATYTWTLPVGWNGSSSSNSITTTVTNSGTISVIASSSCGVIYGPYTLSVTTTPSPTLIASTNNPTICSSNSVTLVASGADTYTWSPGGLNNGTITVAPTNLTVYTVTGTNTNNACFSSTTLTQNVTLYPNLSYITQTSLSCPGGTANLIANGGQNYTWQPGNINTSTITLFPTVTTVYTLTGANPPCVSSINVTITVPPIGTVNIAASSPSICPGFSIALSATNTSGPGPFTYTWTNGPVSNQYNAYNAISGTYIYTVTSQNANSCLSTNTISVDFNPAPALVLSSVTICPGSAGTVSVSGASTYTWMPGSSNSSSLTNSPVSTTVYSVTGMSVLGCTSVATATIYVPSTLTLNISSSSSSVCVGGSITLTALNSGGRPGYTYTWTAGPATASYVVSRTAGVYVFTVTSKDLNNCIAVKTISVSFVALPSVTIPNIPLCFGSTASLTAYGASSYTWSSNNFVGNPLITSPGINTVYNVIGSAAGCTSTASGSITVKPIPSLSFQTASITCASLGTATVTASGAVGPYSYSWSPSGQTNSVAINLTPGVYTLSVFDNGTGCTSISTTTFISLVPYTGTLSATTSLTCNGVNTGTAAIIVSGGSGNQTYMWTNPAGVQTNYFANILSAGIHTVRVTDAVTFCNVTKTFQITQPPAITLSIVQSSTFACVNDSISLSALGIGGTGTHTYTWTSGQTTSQINVTQSLYGIYIYSVNSLDANNCPASASSSFSFTGYPTITVSSPTNICIGALATLSASGASGYLWLPGGFSGNSITIFPSATSSFVVYGTTSGCTSSLTTSVVVNPNPVPVIISNNAVCENQSINLTANGGGNYLWSGPNGFSSVNQNTVITIASVQNIGNYSLSVTDINNCSASTFTFIDVFTVPIISATGASVCLGEPATLSVTGASSYFWSGPRNYAFSGSNAYIPIVDNNTSGSYTVFATGSNSCIAIAVVQVFGIDLPLPTPTIVATAKACVGSPIKLVGLGGSSYLWTGPSNLSSANPTLNFTVSNPGIGGIFTLTVKNESNCAASATVHIPVYALPQATLLNSSNRMCVPFCSEFSLKQSTVNIAPIKGFYFNNNGSALADSVHTLCFQSSGDKTISVNYVDTNNCVNTSTVLISVFPKPEADFVFYPPEPYAAIDRVEFTNLSITTEQSDFTWYFGKDNERSKEKNPVHVFEYENVYPIVLIVKNNRGCADTIIKTISVNEEMSLYVPNSFTPNDDGKNDFFQAKGTGIATYQLNVFDRWGQLLFETSDINNYWDGKFGGQVCKIDTYIWKIDLTGVTGKSKSYQGSVTLIR